MNEQELLMLLEHWEGKEDFLHSAKDSQPTIDSILE
jgi:hypothetical protein